MGGFPTQESAREPQSLPARSTERDKLRAMPKKLFLLAFLLALPALAAPKPVDIVIAHGTVLTMAGPNIDDGAVAIDKGSIVAVGPASKITAAYHGKETINARGMAVLPGFVNTHTHAPMVLFRGIADD